MDYGKEYDAMRIKDTAEHDCWIASKPLPQVFTKHEIDIIYKAGIFDEGETVFGCPICKDLVDAFC